MNDYRVTHIVLIHEVLCARLEIGKLNMYTVSNIDFMPEQVWVIQEAKVINYYNLDYNYTLKTDAQLWEN